MGIGSLWHTSRERTTYPSCLEFRISKLLYTYEKECYCMAGDEKLTTTATSIRLLEMISEQNGATLRDLVSETELAKSTVYKHLSTLQANDLLVKKGEQYLLSLHHLTLGKQAVEMRDSYRLVEQKIDELRNRIKADIDFTVEENGRLILVSEATRTMSESIFVPGNEFYLHNTAAGKAILAAYSEDHVNEILNTHGLPQQTDKTIQSRSELKSELESIRENGYALNDGECVEGYRSVGSVIMNPDDSVLGAISIGGPVYRIDHARLENDFAELVCETTAEISNALL